jgi:ribosomal protein S27AE
MDLTGLSPKEQLKREVTKAYTCPIHAEIISTEPGKCPKCGKTLNLSPKEKLKAEVVKLYACPMHPDQTSDKPGKCPKCGMDLAEKKQ